MKNQQTKKIKKTVLGILGFSILTLGLGFGANSAVFATLRKTELADRNIVLSGIVKEKSEQDSGVDGSENMMGNENSDGGNTKNLTSEGEVLEGEVPEGELEATDVDEGELDEKGLYS